MKYMTFKNTSYFTALANILDKGRINLEDFDVLKNSLIPYVFQKDSITKEYRIAYNDFDDALVSESIKQYGLRVFNKRFPNNLEGLHKFIEELKPLKYVIVSLNLSKELNNHSVLFVRYREPHFVFKNMKELGSKETDYFMYTKEELSGKLTTKIQFSVVLKNKDIDFPNKQVILGKSLTVLKEYKNDLISFCGELHSLKEREESNLFKVLFEDYYGLVKLLKFSLVESKLNILNRQFNDSFKNVFDIKVSTYLDMSLLDSVFNDIMDMILDKLDS